MTFFDKTENKSCFIACEQSKIDSGLCDCINRMPHEGQILPIQNVRQRAFKWWDAMNLEQKFYKTIAANHLIDGDNTRHPHSLNEMEIISIYNFHVA